jgi:hypothetical protein
MISALPHLYLLERLPFSRSATTTHAFDVEDDGRLAPMVVELVDRMSILVVVRRFPSIDALDHRSLRYDNYARMRHFVGLGMSLFVDSWGCPSGVHATSLRGSSWYVVFQTL